VRVRILRTIGEAEAGTRIERGLRKSLAGSGFRCVGELACRRLVARLRHAKEKTAAKFIEQDHKLVRFFIHDHRYTIHTATPLSGFRILTWASTLSPSIPSADGVTVTVHVSPGCTRSVSVRVS